MRCRTTCLCVCVETDRAFSHDEGVPVHRVWFVRRLHQESLSNVEKFGAGGVETCVNGVVTHFQCARMFVFGSVGEVR